MLKNMSIALLISPSKRIITTVAKAKALRKYFEPLVTRAKDNTTHSRRIAFSHLQNKEAVKELFGEVATRIGDRPGGYTRILKIGNRQGDNAEMALIELVDFNEFITEAPKKKTSRRRKKTSTAKKPAAPIEETPIKEAIVDEAPEEDAPEADAKKSSEEEE